MYGITLLRPQRHVIVKRTHTDSYKEVIYLSVILRKRRELIKYVHCFSNGRLLHFTIAMFAMT